MALVEIKRKLSQPRLRISLTSLGKGRKQKSETCLGNVRKKTFPRLVSVKVEKRVSEVSLRNDKKIEF